MKHFPSSIRPSGSLCHPLNILPALTGFALIGLLPTALHAQSVTYAGTGGVNFNGVNVCPAGAATPAPCSATQTLSFSVSAGTTIASIEILTTGAADLDFRAKADDTSTTLCKAQSYTSPATCTVDVTFAPLAPGMRRGAVEFLDGSNNVLATTYVYGTGVGPAIAFTPAAQTVLYSNIEYPTGITLDASGNIFFSNYNSLFEILAVNGSIPPNPAVKTLPPTLYNAGAPVIDGAGNLFTEGIDGFVEVLASGGYNTVVRVGMLYLGAFALDGSANIFTINNGTLSEILAAGGYSETHTFPVSLSSSTEVMAIDANDNLFIVDYDSGAVEEISAAGDYATVTTLATGYKGSIGGLTLDASGNIYFIDEYPDYGGSAVYEIVAAGGYKTVETLLQYSNVEGLAVDGNGNVFLEETGNPLPQRMILELVRSQGPALLSFASPPAGKKGTPQSLVIQNVGNAPLEAKDAGIAISHDWIQAAGSGTPPDCTASFSLAPSFECNLSISFDPSQSGSQTGTVTLTDNVLNAGAPNYATQTIKLSGGSPPLAQFSAKALAFGTVPFGSSDGVTLDITNLGDNPLTVSWSATNGPSYSVVFVDCAPELAINETCSLGVEFTPVTVGGHSDYFSVTTNGGNAPNIPLTGTATGIGPVIETPLEFGTIPLGTTKTLPLKIYNYGVAGSPTMGFSINGPSYKVLPGSTCTTVGVTSGHSCTLQVEYDPVSVERHNDILTISPRGQSPTTVKLWGTTSPAE